MRLSFCVYRALRELSIEQPKKDGDPESYSCPCRVYRPPVWPSVKCFAFSSRVGAASWWMRARFGRSFRKPPRAIEPASKEGQLSQP